MNHTAAPQPTRARVLSLLWFPFFFAAAMSVLYVFAFAHPEPHDLRLGVIGTAPARLPAGFAVRPVTDTSGVAANTLAGVYDSDYLTAVLHPAATVDVVSLAPGDATGVGIFFYGLPIELMPANWPRAQAREVFVAVYDGLAAPAQEHVRTLVTRFSDLPRGEVRAHSTAELASVGDVS